MSEPKSPKNGPQTHKNSPKSPAPTLLNRDFLEVAVLGRTVGLKGGLKLHDRSDFADQFKKGAVFCLKSGEELVVSSYNGANGVIAFENYDSIEAAKVLVNQVLYRTKAQTKAHCKLKKGEFFYFEVMGLAVLESGEELGEVVDILEAGGGFLFEIKTARGLVDAGLNKSFYLPYNDYFCEQINIEARQIIAKGARAILENS